MNWAKDSRSKLQIRDIANLTSSEYDSGYVSEWIDRLSLREIWSEVEEWKTRREKAEK